MTADIPTFDVRIDPDGRVSFVHAAQARGYLRRLRVNSDDEVFSCQVFPVRAKRTDPQNRALHALIASWLVQSESLRGQTIEAVKQWLLSRAFGWDEIVDVETGEAVKVLAEPHTSRLGVGKFCDLIESVLELAAHDGVVLPSPDEYTRAKEKLARKAAREAAKGRAA